jgi:hypothetical protein
MRNYAICLIISVLLNFSSQCQSTHDTCDCLKQYEGEWRYINGSDTITVYLRPHPAFSSKFIHCAYGLIGWYEYKKGKVVIESNYQHRVTSPDSSINDVESCSIFLYQKENCSPLFLDLEGYIKDYMPVCEITDIEIITITAIPPNRLLWKQHQSDASIFINGTHAMTLPKEFLLMKQ